MLKVNIDTKLSWSSSIGALVKLVEEGDNNYLTLLVETYCAGIEKGYSLTEKLKSRYDIIVPDELYEEKETEVSPVQDDIILAARYLNKVKNANKRGIKFSLTLSDFRSIMQRKICYYTGIRMSIDSDKHYPTLERIDNTKGYEKGNVVLCCNFINSLKNMLFENESSEYFSDIKHIRKFLDKM